MDAIRAVLARFVWCCVLRPVLFRLPFLSAEGAHNLTMNAFYWLMKIPGVRWLTSAFFRVSDPRLHVRRFGLEFPNPVGLAAGMDKNAKWHNDLLALGFGFIEVGTVTAQPQVGKPKPRILRLPKDRALLNRMGSPNVGAEKVAAHLTVRPPRAILGINIGKTTTTPNEDAPGDYLASFERLYPFASYFVLNISSPNTPGLRKLQASENLGPILRILMDHNAILARARNQQPKPILVKIAPDLDKQHLNEIVDLCVDLKLAGIIVANTTTSRDGLTKTPEPKIRVAGDGGVSGQPLTRRSRDLVAAVYRRTGKELPIIGVGGIMTADDAWQMIRAGASLVQVHSGLVYSGPGLVAAINRHVAAQLGKRGLSSVEDVVGEASKSLASEAVPSPLGEALSVNS
jgi:dihydroorotate dehydrogenase